MQRKMKLLKVATNSKLYIIALNLDYIKDNEWKVIMMSALMGRGIQPVIGDLLSDFIINICSGRMAN